MVKKFKDFFKRDKNNEDLTDKNINKVDSTDIDKNSVAVENYKGVLQFICDDVERSIKLTTYLKEELTQIFGKHNTIFKGEFFYYVWIVEFEGEIFQIFTANSKGTQFSIIGKYEDDKSRVCINFLRKMEELLDGVGNFNQFINETYKGVDEKVGKEFWFEYHCFESPYSCDAEVWYRSHSKIHILGIVEMGNGETPQERGEIGEPRVYKARFEDGFEYDVWEDEVMDSPNDFFRPDPPKKRG